MTSSRTHYTQYLSELASRGHIVAAIEHRDGSCPATSITAHDGSTQTMFLFKADQLAHPDSPDAIDAMELKPIQFAFRQAEVAETIQVLRSIDNGFGPEIHKLNRRHEGVRLPTFAGALDFDRLTMAGHSYGATLALQTLAGAPSETLPITSAIVLDPGKNSGPLNTDIAVPLLVIHSQSWSAAHSVFNDGRPHFAVVKELVQGVLDRGKDAWFMTSLGTSHASVTDAPLIQPLLLSWSTGSSIDVKDGVGQHVQRSAEFLEYLRTEKKGGILGEKVTHGEFDVLEKGREGRQAEREWEKYWQIHVAPN